MKNLKKLIGATERAVAILAAIYCAYFDNWPAGCFWLLVGILSELSRHNEA